MVRWVIQFLSVCIRAGAIPLLTGSGAGQHHPHYGISWRNNWMLRQSDYVVTYVTHHWGGAASIKNKANSAHKIFVEINGS